jgi:hypothetical protein
VSTVPAEKRHAHPEPGKHAELATAERLVALFFKRSKSLLKS